MAQETQDTQHQDDGIIDAVYAEVVQVFGGNIPPSAVEENASTFEELTAKALKYAKDNGIQLYNGFVADHAEDIKNLPDTVSNALNNMVQTDSNVEGQVNQLKKDTNTFVKYILFILAGLFTTILIDKFAKVVAAVGLFIIAVLLFKYFTNKYKSNELAPAPAAA